MKYSILVIDNTEFHYIYIEEIKNTCYVKGVLVLFLLPYSSDFNLIEEFFSIFKAYIKKTYRRYCHCFADYYDYIEWALH